MKIGVIKPRIILSSSSRMASNDGNLEYLTASIDSRLEHLWFYTAKYEKGQVSKSVYAGEKTAEELAILEKTIDSAYHLFNSETGGRMSLLGHLEYNRAKFLYLKAKYLKASGNIKSSEELYLEAAKQCKKALLVYEISQDFKGKVLATELYAIIQDQNYKQVIQKKRDVIEPLNELIGEMCLKHTSYHYAFETALHLVEIMTGLVVGSMNWLNTGRKKNHDEHGGLPHLLKLLGGYLISWLILEKVIVKPLCQYILKSMSLGTLPEWYSGLLVNLLQWAFEREELIDTFEIKANIHHDLMKGYQKIGDERHIEYNKKQSQFYFRELIKMLNPPDDYAKIREIEEYMNS